MKARITTVLSLTGVLVAGSAAALVNTQVLQNSGPKKSSTESIIESTSSAVPASPSSIDKPALGEDLGKALVPSTTPGSTQVLYDLSPVGTVTLDTAGDVLAVAGVTTGDGWSNLGQENVDPLTVRVTFVSGTKTVVFTANLLMGEITTNVESSDSATSTSVGGSQHSGDDDGDDDSSHHGSDDDSHESGDDD